MNYRSSNFGKLSLSQDLRHQEFLRLEKKFHTIIEALPNGILMVDESGHISLFNSETLRLFGFSAEEMSSMKVEDLIPERFRANHPSYRNAFFQSPQIRAMGAGRDLHGRRKDGTEFPIEIGLNPLRTDEGMFILAAIVDITERKAADARFRSVVESMPNALVVVDEFGLINFVNSRTEQLFGFEPNALAGQAIEVLIPARFGSTHPHHLRSFFQEPSARAMGAGRELYGQHSNGREIPLEIALQPLEVDKRMMVLAVIVDITQRQAIDRRLHEANQELQQKNQEMEQFVYTVSHDLKSPIVTNMSFLQFIREDLANDRTSDVLDSLDRLERSNRRMSQLISDLLLLSRIGRIELQRERVDMDMLMSDIVQVYSERDDDVDCQINIRKPLLPLFADRFRLTQLFDNLVGNALKYTRDQKQIRIDIGSIKKDGFILVYVKDNGPGIAKEFHSRIFGLFERLATDKEGTGVGLAIAARVVQLHSGRIWVESEIGQGAAFWVEFPDHEGASTS